MPNSLPPEVAGTDAPANRPAARETQAALALALPGMRFAMGLLSATILIAGLYFGRGILIPLALAVLLGFVLDPLVGMLRRRRVPRAAAVIVVVTAAIAVLGLAAMLLGGQVRALSAELPTYQTNIKNKLHELRERARAPGMFDGAIAVMDTVQSEVAATEAVPPGSKKAPATLQRVQLVEQPSSPVARAMEVLAAAGGPLADAGIVLVFLVLMLIDRQDLRDRLLRLLGGSLHATTDAMDEAGTRISKYLTMQLVVNASYGLPMAAGLWAIGVPGAILWGALAAVMRFVPYIGPMISAVFPLALAFAVDPGWNMVLWTLGLIVLLELLSNNVVEPWLYGASTGLSAMSLMVAATFWTALWGPIGLVMSTPLTVCLLVVGRHLPHLAFFDTLLGSQPALDAPTRLYQRLLAGDVEEAIEFATERLALEDSGGVAGFYHQVGVPALRQASGDHDSVSTAEHRHRLVTGMDALIDELHEQHPVPAGAGRPRVVCIGGKWEADTLAARMLAHALALGGVPAEHRSAGLAGADALARLDLHGARSVCLSFFSPEPQTRARYLCRRLRRRWPDLHIVLALWNAPPELLDEAGTRALGADAAANSIDEAVLRIGQHLGGDLGEKGYTPAPVPEADLARVRALRASGVLGDAVRARFDLAAKRAADIFDVPLAMVSLIDEDQQLVRGASGTLPALAGQPAAALDVPRELSMCGHVVANAETLVVEDIARDPRFANNPMLLAGGLRFYAGAPLTDDEGHVYGSLCLLDTVPRALNAREVRLLEAMAAELMASLDLAGVGVADEPPAEPPAADQPRLDEPPSATVGQLVPS